MYSNSLEQYYTQQAFGALIASNFLFPQPKRLLELGVGQGILTGAIKERWGKIDIVSTDVDELNFLSAKRLYPEGQHFQFNAIDDNLPNLMGVDELSMDIAVCNPPYTAIKSNEKISRILEYSGFHKVLPSNCEITADLIFLAQNIRFLRPGGELGIIVPDGLVTGHNFEWLRSLLIVEHCVFTVIDLPEKIFLGTEAKTHVLMIRKNTPSDKTIKILKSNEQGEIEDEISVDVCEAVHRMDYGYHKWKKRQSCKNKQRITLESIGADIKRGTHSRKQLLQAKVEHFHTTDFKSIGYGSQVSFSNRKPSLEGLIAEAGDIIMPRVGKRCLDNVALVKKGGILLSDCVYRIRVPEEYRLPFFEKLRSEEGRSWSSAHAHGVCAKVISKKDLKDFWI